MSNHALAASLPLAGLKPSPEGDPGVWLSPRPKETRESVLIFDHKQSKPNLDPKIGILDIDPPSPPPVEVPLRNQPANIDVPIVVEVVSEVDSKRTKKKGRSRRERSTTVNTGSPLPSKRKKRESIASAVAVPSPVSSPIPPKKTRIRSTTELPPMDVGSKAFPKESFPKKNCYVIPSPRIDAKVLSVIDNTSHSVSPKESSGKGFKPSKKSRLGSKGVNFEFLLSATREGFLQMKEKTSKKWHRRWVALGIETLRCHKDVVVSIMAFG